jgi:1,4-dihydroxy-2-naphthoate octaprenyltransferase
MKVDEQVLDEIRTGYAHAVVVFLDSAGYPVSVSTSYEVDVQRGAVVLGVPAGHEVAPPTGREVNVIFSHIHPQENVGYDERRYVSLWGKLEKDGQHLLLRPDRVQAWDEAKTPFFQYSEETVPQAKRYLEDLSGRVGRPVKPRLSLGWTILRTTRLPFLSATIIPVLLGVAVAALDGRWSIALALAALLGGSLIHLALNVANDVFDTLSGADAANVNPTQFSGGSRMAHYGLVSVKQLAWLSTLLYLGGIGIGLWLAAETEFWPLFTLGAIGIAISVFYTAPPFRLVHRGIGEIAVALGFGPIVLLGSYFVQAERFTLEAGILSIPVAIFIALVLYVNEIPDRAGDAKAGKRTLPVRWSKRAVIAGYAWAALAAYATILVGAITGVLPRPTIIALGTIPLAIKVLRGLRADYDSPYTLMATMGENIKLHGMTGMLLFVGYLIAIAADRLMDSVPLVLR